MARRNKNVAAVALEEPHAEQSLELADLSTESRLRDVTVARSRAEALLVGLTYTPWLR